jgi:hypothetical protein
VDQLDDGGGLDERRTPAEALAVHGHGEDQDGAQLLAAVPEAVLHQRSHLRLERRNLLLQKRIQRVKGGLQGLNDGLETNRPGERGGVCGGGIHMAAS